MSAFKYNHMMEIIAICQAGKDPSKVAYHELTRADQDSALRREIAREMRCGGAPCDWVHTGVPRPERSEAPGDHKASR